MIYTVYGLRVCGSTEVRYVGQTRRSLSVRLQSEQRLAENYVKWSVAPLLDHAKWLLGRDGEVEIFPILTCPDRESALNLEKQVIAVFLAANHRLFNQHHVPAERRLRPWTRITLATPRKRSEPARDAA